VSRVSQPTSFVYLAASPAGRKRFGMRQADSARRLAESLRRDRLLLLRSWELPSWLATGGATLGLKDRSELNTQLGQLLGRGVPLVETLEVVASTVSARAKPRVERMRELVQAGSSFAEACRQAGASDDVTTAVYRAAERSGDLAGAAEHLAMNLRRQMAVRGRAVTLMIYPAIVLSITVVVSSLLVMFIVPRIGKSLLEGGIELPLYSRLIVSFGNWLRDNIGLVGLGLVALAALGVVARAAAGRGLGSVMRRLPGIRELVLAQERARFFSTMSAMSRSGVPLADALSVANETIGHPVLGRQLRRLRERLVEGGVFRHLVEDVDSLPLATRRLLVAAERSGDLERALEMLADDTAEEVDRRATRMLAGLEPALIVVMFVLIGSLLLAIMTPLLTVSSQAL